MALSIESSTTWNEIEHSESYLVCCMFDEAASLASSVLRHLCDSKCTEAIVRDIDVNDMLESAGMVLVQSLKELGRTLDILKELKLLFGSSTAIPVHVLLTGSCFQIQEGSSGVREFLEEYLSKWRCVDERNHGLASSEEDISYMEGCDTPFVLGVDKYLEVVEMYVVTLLAMTLKDVDLAIFWVEKAALPEQKRQELLRQLRSMYSSKVTSSSQASVSPLVTDASETRSNELNMYEKPQKFLGAQNPSNGENGAKQAILKLSGQRVPCSWWFRTITLKFGNGRLVISNGNILLGCLTCVMYYFMRRKQATIKRILRRQVLYMKKAVVDLWQLAFAYQVNPLAAVQPLPSATRGSR